AGFLTPEKPGRALARSLLNSMRGFHSTLRVVACRRGDNPLKNPSQALWPQEKGFKYERFTIKQDRGRGRGRADFGGLRWLADAGRKSRCRQHRCRCSR